MKTMTREEVLERIRIAYGSSYDLDKDEMEESRSKTELPVIMTAAYHSLNEKYVLSKKAVLWEANCHEYMYFFEIPHLTEALAGECITYAYEEGMKLIKPGKGHMCSYITAVFICDTLDNAAKKRIKKSRYYKSFHFSFHGWMDFHAAAIVTDSNEIVTNQSGKCVGDVMKNILFKKKKGSK